MNTHRNRKLYDLATKNSQRLSFEQVCTEAPDSLTQFFEAQIKLFHPETPEVLKKAISRCGRLHSKTEDVGATKMLETTYKEKAFVWFRSNVNQLPAGDYLVWFGAADGVTFDGKLDWVPDLPVVKAPMAAIIPVIDDLIGVSSGKLAIVKSNSDAVIVMDTYSGYLVNEPSEKEIVYELTYWNNDG